MTSDADTSPVGQEASAESEEFTVLKGVLVLEFIAILIALAMPVTPSKTGSDFSPAEWLFGEPSYVQDVAVYFVATNALFALLGAVLWVWLRVGRARSRHPGHERADTDAEAE